jgi:hypothetical protein
MLKKLVYLFCLTNLALLLQSCCYETYPYPIKITISSIPKQDSIVVWGIKNGKALEKISVKDNYYGMITDTAVVSTYLFGEALDMSMNTSTLAIQYYKKNQVLQIDTITLSYTRNASYERNCGAILNISKLKLEKSTAKLPITITVNP